MKKNIILIYFYLNFLKKKLHTDTLLWKKRKKKTRIVNKRVVKI
jgi:hypothetical protein